MKTETKIKATQGTWTLQAPRQNANFGDQTFYAIPIEGTFDCIGFLYPNSKHSTEVQQANAEKIVQAVNNHDSLIEGLEFALKEYIRTQLSISTLANTKYVNNEVVIKIKEILNKAKNESK